MDMSPPVKITSIRDMPRLAAWQYHGEASFKAAILPFYMRDGQPHFVVYAPVPTREASNPPQLPLQIARGTMQRAYMHDGGLLWLDHGRQTPPSGAVHLYDEVPYVTALREGEEELGLPGAAIMQLYACGCMSYRNPRGAHYGLHMFLAEIPGAHMLHEPDVYACAARHDHLTWDAVAQGEAMPCPFKPSYREMLHALHDAVISL